MWLSVAPILKVRETIILATCCMICFLWTPHFALNCGDVPRVETGTMLPYRVTMQHFTPLVILKPSASQSNSRSRNVLMHVSSSVWGMRYIHQFFF